MSEPMIDATTSQYRTSDPYEWGVTFEWADYLLASTFVPLILLGTFANTKTCVLLLVNRGHVKLNAYVILSVTLCVSDTLMLLFTGIPTTVSMFKLRRAIPHPYCTISGWFLNFNIRLCSFITTCICSMRCFAVLCPLRSKSLLGNKSLVLIVVASSTLAFLSASLPFFFSDPGNWYQVKYYQFNRAIGYCFFILPISYTDNWFLTMLLIEGVFFVPFAISIVTCCVMIPVLRSKSHHGPINCAEARTHKAIWSICRITLFTVACFAPQLVWSILDKVCDFYSSNCSVDIHGSDYCRHCASLTISTYLNYSLTHLLMNFCRATFSPFVSRLGSYISQLSANHRMNGVVTLRSLQSRFTQRVNNVGKMVTSPVRFGIPKDDIAFQVCQDTEFLELKSPEVCS